jgi:hypothetical protein
LGRYRAHPPSLTLSHAGGREARFLVMIVRLLGAPCFARDAKAFRAAPACPLAGAITRQPSQARPCVVCDPTAGSTKATGLWSKWHRGAIKEGAYASG